MGANFGFNHTESGWMKGQAFYFFVTQHDYPRWIEMNHEFPIVLVIDGYSAHKSAELFIWCKQHDIILLLLYPNSTHILQVLDIAIFGPLKCKYNEMLQDWKDLHLTETFTELEFIKVLKVTNDAVLKPTSIINGWRASGLQPFNFFNINLEGLVTKLTTEAVVISPSVVDDPSNFIYQLEDENQLHSGDQFEIESQYSIIDTDNFSHQIENESQRENEHHQLDVESPRNDECQPIESQLMEVESNIITPTGNQQFRISRPM